MQIRELSQKCQISRFFTTDFCGKSAKFPVYSGKKGLNTDAYRKHRYEQLLPFGNLTGVDNRAATDPNISTK